MAKPNVDKDRIAHGAAPSVLAELNQAITDFRRSPNFVYHCAIMAAFLCLGLGTLFLKWGTAGHSQIIVGAALALFILSFVIWAALGIVALGMLWSVITDVARAAWRKRR